MHLGSLEYYSIYIKLKFINSYEYTSYIPKTSNHLGPNNTTMNIT